MGITKRYFAKIESSAWKNNGETNSRAEFFTAKVAQSTSVKCFEKTI